MIELVLFGAMVFALFKIYEAFWWARILMALFGILMLLALPLGGLYLSIGSFGKGDLFVGIMQISIGLFLSLPAYIAATAFLDWYKHELPRR
jgi:hypothetical protein